MNLSKKWWIWALVIVVLTIVPPIVAEKLKPTCEGIGCIVVFPYELGTYFAYSLENFQLFSVLNEDFGSFEYDHQLQVNMLGYFLITIFIMLFTEVSMKVLKTNRLIARILAIILSIVVLTIFTWMNF
jgi:hypothetical protein